MTNALQMHICSEEIGSVMAADLSQTLFELWVQAAFREYIPSPSYWKTLSSLCRKWIIQVADLLRSAQSINLRCPLSNAGRESCFR